MIPEYAERVIADVADTSTVLPAVIAAIAAGKYKEAGAFLTEDVILDIKGVDRMNGRWHGREAVVDAMARNFGMVQDQRPVIDATIHSGYTTALLFHETGIFAGDGEPYSIRAVMWVTYDNGLIHRVDEIVAVA
jgi:ketosteroid isomerase-like protein